MWESIGEYFLWVHPYFTNLSCSSYWDNLWDGRWVAVQLLFVFFFCFFLWVAAFRICSKQHSASFFFRYLIKVHVVQLYGSTGTVTSWKIPILFFQWDQISIWLSTWRCPWCNGYRCRKWTRRHEFKSWTRLIAFHIALIPLGKVWIQLFSLQLWVNSRTALVRQLV